MPKRYTTHDRQPVARRPNGFYSRDEVESLTTLGKTAIYARGAAGTFPPPVRLSSQATGWRCEEVNAWLDDPTGWRASPDVAA